MRERLLEVLAEPRTGAKVRLEGARREGKEIIQGELVSEETGRRYPIVRGIPRFVETEGYADNFGLQWNRFRAEQLDSATQSGRSRRRFDAEAGWTPDELRGRWVLDAGCGAGRFAEVAAERGGDLVALDLSSAVEATRATLTRFPNVDVVQGSVLEPPFRCGAFDFAYCIGVAQHTPDPARAVAAVVRSVRPAGRFCLTIYARRRWTKLNGKYLVRPLTRRVPKKALLRAIEKTMPFVFPVTDTLFRLPAVGRLAQFAIPVATYVDCDELTREQRYREAVLDTFDMLAPRYDSPMTWQEVEAVLRASGASAWNFRTRVPICCVGTR
jgi:SAM-dependent methyltransferase